MEGKAPIAKQNMNVPLALKYNLELLNFLSPGSELPALWARPLWLQGSDRLPPQSCDWRVDIPNFLHFHDISFFRLDHSGSWHPSYNLHTTKKAVI